MFEGSSDFLAYALVLFLGWVYLPYTFFKFSAEVFIDLGRRRDSTHLEEIISAFLPSVLLNLQALLIFKICSIHDKASFAIDFAVMAAMFGNRQGSCPCRITSMQGIGGDRRCISDFSGSSPLVTAPGSGS
jgi:hypothetical protein